MTAISHEGTVLTISKGGFVCIERAGGDSQCIEWADLPENLEARRWIEGFLLLVAQSALSGLI